MLDVGLGTKNRNKTHPIQIEFIKKIENPDLIEIFKQNHQTESLKHQSKYRD